MELVAQLLERRVGAARSIACRTARSRWVGSLMAEWVHSIARSRRACKAPTGAIRRPTTVRSADLAASWGVRECRLLTGVSVRFASREAVAEGMPLSLRRSLVCASRLHLARFEIFPPDLACAGILARLTKAKFPVRQWVHERQEPSPAARESSRQLADLLRREHLALADFLVALSEFDRAGAYRRLGFANLFDYLLRELQHFPGSGPLPEGGGPARRPVPRGGGAAAGRAAVPDSSIVQLAKVMTEANRAEVLPEVLPLLEAGGEAGRGGDHAGGGGAEEDGGHRDPGPQ